MSLPELFVKKEQSFVKEANFRLNSNPDAWEEEIIEKLHEEHPYFPDYDLDVKIRKKDENTGMGIGQITVDEMIRIPVVIKDARLEPLDMMYYGGKLLPITKHSIENITHKSTLGKPVKRRSTGADMGIRSATQAPHYGKYAYASLNYSRDEVSEAVASAYDSLEGFAYDVKDSSYLAKGIHNYMFNAEEPVVKEASAPSMEILSNREVQDVREGGVRSLGTQGRLFKIASFDGSFHEQSLYIDTQGRYSYTSSIPGFSEQIKIAEEQPSKGTGCFYVETAKGDICLEPVDVLYKTAEYTQVRTQLGERLRVYQSEDFSGFVKVANHLYLSNDWKFAPITEKVAIPSKSGLEKMASAGADLYVRKLRNGFYVVQGDTSAYPEIQKIAEAPVTFVEIKNGFSAYCTPDQLEQIHKEADEFMASKIKTIVPEEVTPHSYEDMPKLASEDKRNFIKVAGILTENIVKEAGIDDKEADRTVDSILGLNFLNDQNINQMLDLIDELEIARSVLGRLLIAGRLGLDIDVSAVKSAVFALDSVIKDLRGFRQAHLGQ